VVRDSSRFPSPASRIRRRVCKRRSGRAWRLISRKSELPSQEAVTLAGRCKSLQRRRPADLHDPRTAREASSGDADSRPDSSGPATRLTVTVKTLAASHEVRLSQIEAWL